MSNPFKVRWLMGWTFQTVLMEGGVQVEARGFGICLRTPLRHGESPIAAADRLVLAEDRRRRALHAAWLRGEHLASTSVDQGIEGLELDPNDTPTEQSLIQVAA